MGILNATATRVNWRIQTCRAVPSLLSINYHAPYLHRRQAQILEEVFRLHGLGPDGQELMAPRPTSAPRGDFRDALRLQGTCPTP